MEDDDYVTKYTHHAQSTLLQSYLMNFRQLVFCIQVVSIRSPARMVNSISKQGGKPVFSKYLEEHGCILNLNINKTQQDQHFSKYEKRERTDSSICSGTRLKSTRSKATHSNRKFHQNFPKSKVISMELALKMAADFNNPTNNKLNQFTTKPEDADLQLSSKIYKIRVIGKTCPACRTKGMATSS